MPASHGIRRADDVAAGQAYNRRRFERHEMPVALGIWDGNPGHRGGVIRNIGGGGLQFHSAHSFPHGRRLQLAFRTPRQGIECYVFAVVVRSDVDPTTDRTSLPHVTSVKFD